MRIYLNVEQAKELAKYLTPKEVFNKNVVILNALRDDLMINKMTSPIEKYLRYLEQYFVSIEAYEYCSVIMKIFEENKKLIEYSGTF
jgi:hypothetical protein